MFKVQFKAKSPYGSWQTLGNYGTESQAIAAAIAKKRAGAILVKVTDKKNSIVYTG
jgi:hypothetical protein